MERKTCNSFFFFFLLKRNPGGVYPYKKRVFALKKWPTKEYKPWGLRASARSLHLSVTRTTKRREHLCRGSRVLIHVGVFTFFFVFRLSGKLRHASRQTIFRTVFAFLPLHASRLIKVEDRQTSRCAFTVITALETRRRNR